MIVNGIKLLRICSVYSSRIHSFSSRTSQRSIQLRVLNSRRMASSSDLDVDNRPTNELIHERSLYLLQHARNPVQWYPWGQAAFIRARNEKKLIFLSVGYSTCHWCHVMERESFENPEIAALMNSHFINIKVDREERPDIDRMYMTFVQLTSGNCGWPMSVFLTPDLNPVAGGTYFPPEDRWGHRGFKTVLQDIAKQWKDNPEKLKKTGEKVVDMLKKASTFEVGIVHSLTKGQVPEENCDQLCFQQLARQFDENFGGFDMSPKFPQPPNLNFLFHFYSRNSSATENTKALDMALKTLEMMAKGGIHDHVGQGFARYSVDEKWHVPHFEKMLYDQGQLAVAYATAFLITQRPLFKEILDDVLEYVERDLSFEKGGFFSAEDADSEPSDKDKEKREGAYYVWKYEEIADLLSKPVKSNPKVTLNEVFAHHYNVKKGGNVDPKDDPHGELLDKNVLIVYGSEKNTAEKFELSEEDLKFELDRARKILFEQRKLRPRPELDTKIITAWNGLMLSGYAKAAQVLDNEDYKERAIRAAKFVKMYLSKTNGELLHCCYTNSAKTKVLQTQHPIPAFLNDYAFLIRGLLDLYDCTYDPDYIEWSEKLQEKQNDLFWDNKHKAYNLNLISDTSVLLPLKEDQDGAEPSGNSVSVHNLIRLGTLLDKKSYLEKVEQILSVFTSRLTRFPISLPEMVSGLMFYHDAPMEIFIVGPQDHETTKEMLALIHKHYIPNRVLAVVDDDNSILYRKSETVRDMKDNKTDVVCAHVCRKRICSLPVTEVKSLEALLN